jgi:hypothetical protein
MNVCVCCYNRCYGNVFKEFWALCILSVCWLIGDNLLLRGFGRYGIIFMLCMCAFITVAIAMLIWNFGPYGITLQFPVIPDG